MRTRVLLAGMLGALTTASAASAADLTTSIPNHPKVTGFDLARLVVTDLTSTDDGATGHHVVKFRHIEGKDMLAAPGDTITLGDDSVAIIAVPGSADRVMALIDLGGSQGNVEEAELLALYALTPKLRLLDVVEVGNDSLTAVEDNPPALGRGAALIVVDSGHSNSSETYNDAELIFLRGDRFQLIDSMFTYSISVCAYQRTQEATYGTAPASGPYRSVTVSVREETTLTHEDGCDEEPKPPKPGVVVYAGTYRWVAPRGRFLTSSAQLKKLDALNAAWLKNGA